MKARIAFRRAFAILRYMELQGIRTGILRKGDDLVSHLHDVQEGDIVVVSSKVVATIEGAAWQLGTLQVGDEAMQWSERSGRSDAFCEAVLRETARMNGRVVHHCKGALFCELRPDGLAQGVILSVNAGLDESNTAEGQAIGWPVDPVHSACRLQEGILERTGMHTAVIIGDSCCTARREGVTAFAIATCNIDPVHSRIGEKDLFGKPLRMTKEATADQLTIAANMLMGNGGSGMPVVYVRDHGYPFSGFRGWVSGIDPADDIFPSAFSDPSLA